HGANRRNIAMGLFSRKTAPAPGKRPAGPRRGSVSVSVSSERTSTTRSAVVEPVDAGPVKPVVERFEGTTIEPSATAAFRISSAADVDPNVKKYGADGVFKGGAGGYGGAGTK
ncbi:MAG: hypothetical protein ABIM89_18395, partial [Mycobacteriales bacterium]